MEYVELARAASPRGELVLRERREDGAAPVLELRANGIFVMDSAETSTEVALATAVLEQIAEPRTVVIGGLGLGYTLQAVLADTRVEEVRVVEIEEALIGWMRDGTIAHGPALLADRRVRIVNADLVQAVLEARSRYGLVLLDVDNGPDHLVHADNARLYRAPLLRRIHDLLRPGGALVVWSMSRSEELEASLRQVFDQVSSRALPVLLGERRDECWLHTGLRHAVRDHHPHD